MSDCFVVFEDPLGGTYEDGYPGNSTSFISQDCVPPCSNGLCGGGTTPVQVPEPGTLALLLIGLVAMVVLRRRAHFT